MWSKFKWDMFVTSFIPLWVSIIIFDVWDIVDCAITSYPKKEKPLEKLLPFLSDNAIPIISILYLLNSIFKKCNCSAKVMRGYGLIKASTEVTAQLSDTPRAA